MDLLLSMLLDYGVKLLGSVLGILLIFLFVQAKKYLELKLGKDLVETAVRSIEQTGILEGWNGPEKKMAAVVTIQAMLKKAGLKFSDALVGDLIEATVQIINTEAGAFDKAYAPAQIDALADV